MYIRSIYYILFVTGSTPVYQPFKQGEGFSVVVCKPNKTHAYRTPLYRWTIGNTGQAVNEFCLFTRRTTTGDGWSGRIFAVRFVFENFLQMRKNRSFLRVLWDIYFDKSKSFPASRHKRILLHLYNIKVL